ncbi:outer membrane protein assembly factor BamD [Ancylobacter pratisalsi]|uniref:Outer membrane protein assembly factor BamD n=1 Tax=Ancylobacter pratisalsi TaxID=1745854 RepID=A0A6P1YRL8_9HYPH|nr:outer membrane protein assembly factor BamD [Ancylobacter pratisalsi]QIB36128.1 outer membrane protein assembly factor BamD [Ancylobacter pratisalsi]
MRLLSSSRPANTAARDRARRARVAGILALRLVGLVVVGASLSGCAGMFDTDKEEKIYPDVPAEQRYNEGLTLMEKQDYAEAMRRFEDVDRQHPYSELARKSILMIAYINYSLGNYDECIAASRRYLALHPGSADAAYAQFLMASSYYDQIPDISRDQTRTQRAIDALEDVVRKYPDSEYAVSAKKKLEIARDQIAGKEMMVGRYYLEQRNYAGAINRFKVVVTRYQTTRHVEEALYRLTEAYMALGVISEAQTSAAVLGYNFPESSWYKDAYKLVQSRGVDPKLNEKSWIAKAFKGIGLG